MDRYIDNGETQTYGPQFSANLRRMFTEPGPVQTFMLWCAAQLDAQTATMDGAMDQRRAAASTLSASAQEKLPVVQEARGELKTFTLHLAAKKSDRQEAWDGDPELFVPGGLGGVGKGARAIHGALGVARRALDADTSVPERKKWLARLDAQAEALAPFVAQTDDETHAARAALSEQSSEKRAWLRTYRGVALVLEGVLLMMGRDGEYTNAVPHLTAPGGRKKTDGTPNAPARPSQPSPA